MDPFLNHILLILHRDNVGFFVHILSRLSLSPIPHLPLALSVFLIVPTYIPNHFHDSSLLMRLPLLSCLSQSHSINNSADQRYFPVSFSFYFCLMNRGGWAYSTIVMFSLVLVIVYVWFVFTGVGGVSFFYFHIGGKLWKKGNIKTVCGRLVTWRYPINTNLR